MQRTSIKWGKAAKLAAAAAVVFAMREQGRGDRTHYAAVSTSPPIFLHFRSNWLPWPGFVLSHPGLMLYGYRCGLLGSILGVPYSRQAASLMADRVSHQLNFLFSFHFFYIRMRTMSG